MTANPHTVGEGPIEPVFIALANDRRRRLLVALDERSGAASISELARVLANRTTASAPLATTSSEYRAVRTKLHHVHVPILVEAGLLERNEDEVVLAKTVIGRRVASLMDAPVADSSLDAAFEVLAHRHRRAAIATLRAAGQPLAVADVAEGVSERSPDDRSMRADDRSMQALAVSLTHVHLPKLVEVDVIDYDRSGGWVAFDGLSLACQEVLECMTGRLTEEADQPGESANPNRPSTVSEKHLLELPLT